MKLIAGNELQQKKRTDRYVEEFLVLRAAKLYPFYLRLLQSV